MHSHLTCSDPSNFNISVSIDRFNAVDEKGEEENDEDERKGELGYNFTLI